MRAMEFVVSCDVEEFKRYYKETLGELGVTEEQIINQNPSHLIIWREDYQILGYAIWHESNTEEHPNGDPRDKTDKELLEKLLGGKKEFVELHELWLKIEHRGKGYGKKFFEFFEEFIANNGYTSIIYYTDNPAAIALCRQRGYKEAYGVNVEDRTFYIFFLEII